MLHKLCNKNEFDFLKRFEWRLMSHMLTLKLFGKYQNRQMLNQIEETRRTLDDINSKIHTLKCEFERLIAEGV